MYQMQVHLYNEDIQTLNEKDPLCLNWSRFIKSRALAIHYIRSLSGRISCPKVGMTPKLLGVTLKVLVPGIVHLSQGELKRSQFCLDNGRIHFLRPLMNKKAAVGIEMSGLGKLDCNTTKSFAYWGGGGSFQESWPPWYFLLLSALLPAMSLCKLKLGAECRGRATEWLKTAICSDSDMKMLHCYWWASINIP